METDTLIGFWRYPPAVIMEINGDPVELLMISGGVHGD